MFLCFSKNHTTDYHVVGITQFQTTVTCSCIIQIYAEMIGNVMIDARSTGKYYHFVRLMGRAASHITLECALQTHPNITIIGEEVISLSHDVVDENGLWKKKLTSQSQQLFEFLPQAIQEQLMLERDPHGNVQVAKIETEKMLIQMVET
ncbi:hypothetical protein Pint_09785 [Pistacia integerrima]|uniref:Uncharacterized protein n=1 Tax=Pistacia integerrima TaxID=434235 RepID=A0ACC0XM34_9ROSI|nr:hypothetical protein Pint_09785 [Pistacia integerrima]